MEIKVYTLNSFAKEQNGGNPAGVVLNADNLTESQMKFITGKIGFSETAFIQKSQKADFKVRFFTPTDEVDLCGHATIASYFLMWKLEELKPGNYKQETMAGLLGIDVSENGIIFMEQNKPQFFETLDKQEVSDILKIPSDNFIDELPIQIVSTGLKDIFVPIKSIEYLYAMTPDMDKMSDFNKKTETIGFHIFTLETKYDATAHCRNFAPLYGIPEESATGTSNGALACYLFKYGLLDNKKLDSLVFEQGYSMEKPSEILAKLEIDKNLVENVKVGGRAIISKELKIEV